MPSGSSVREGGESDGGEPPSEVTDASPMDTGRSRDCSRVVCLVVAVSDRGMSLMEGNHPLRLQMPHLWTQVSPEIVAGLCA